MAHIDQELTLYTLLVEVATFTQNTDIEIPFYINPENKLPAPLIQTFFPFKDSEEDAVVFIDNTNWIVFKECYKKLSEHIEWSSIMDFGEQRDLLFNMFMCRIHDQKMNLEHYQYYEEGTLDFLKLENII